MKRQRILSKVWFTFVLLLCGGLESPFLLWSLGLRESEAWAGPLLGHVAASILIFFGPPKYGSWFGRRRHWADMLCLWTFLMPGWGWLVGGFLFLAHSQKDDKKGYIWEEDTSEQDVLDWDATESSTSVEKRVLTEADLIPAVDVLLSSDDRLKRGAIQTLARIKTPEAIDWILRCRTHDNPDVRFCANSTLTSLKREYEQGLKAASLYLHENPHNLKAQVNLARFRQEYAVSGLVDLTRKRDLLSQSREGLLDLADRHTEALEVLFQVDKILHPDQALGWLTRLNKKQPDDELKWIKEHILLLFDLGRFQEIPHKMKELNHHYKSQDKLSAANKDESAWKAAVGWWTHE